MPARTAVCAAALLATAGLTVGPAVAAQASIPYPPAGGGTISDTTPEPGSQITVTARKGEFRGGEQVEVGVESTYQKLTTVRAAANGSATARITLPSDLGDGDHAAVLTGLASGNVLRLGFTLTIPSASGDGLPTTGSASTLPLATSGLALTALGLGIVVVARRRRTAV